MRPPDSQRSLGDQARAALQLVLPFFGNDPATRPPPHDAVAPGPGERWREIDLGDQKLRYLFRQRKRRSIGFTIDRRGLLVSAPRSVTMAAVDEALREKARWIKAKLAEWSEFEARLIQLQTEWRDGGNVRYLGTDVRLSVQGPRRAPVLQRAGAHDDLQASAPAGSRSDAHTAAWQLLLSPAMSDSPERIQRVVERWLKRQAHDILAERLAMLAERLGQGPSRWELSSARTLWGSCTHDGVIRLNWRLVHLREPLIDYVVAHELAHLRELNHGPAFWKTVGDILPQWQAARRELSRMPEHLAL